MGRKPSYTEGKAQEICERLAKGESLVSICSGDDMPCTMTVFKWINDVEGFSDRYAHARELQAESQVDEIVDIADRCIGTPEEIQKAKLRIDTRKWAASKMKPKKYGDKQVNEHKHEGAVKFVIQDFSKEESNQ